MGYTLAVWCHTPPSSSNRLPREMAVLWKVTQISDLCLPGHVNNEMQTGASLYSNEAARDNNVEEIPVDKDQH